MTQKTSKSRKPIQVYAFIDTNIFLDFYRANNEATLKLLERLMPVSHRIISTYQVEMEFLKNRQTVLTESLNNVKNPSTPVLPAIFSDSSISNSLKTLAQTASKKTSQLKIRINNLFENPKKHDAVFSALDQIFKSTSEHVLTRDMKIRHRIKRLALRRFLLGYPPRKKNDTSIGDALNWEWIIYCATKFPGKFVIVSRDSDYGTTTKDKSFLNDALLHEFKERVGRRKSITYTTKLSEALKELQIHVPDKEIQAENEILENISSLQVNLKSTISRATFDEWFRRIIVENDNDDIN